MISGTGKNKKGFTLVEVLLSVALLSIGLVWILQGYGSILQSIRKARFLTEGSHLLQEKMADQELKIRTGEIQGGSDSGVEGKLEWSTEVVEKEKDEWYELTGKVKRGEGEEISVTTYVRQ